MIFKYIKRFCKQGIFCGFLVMDVMDNHGRDGASFSDDEGSEPVE